MHVLAMLSTHANSFIIILDKGFISSWNSQAFSYFESITDPNTDHKMGVNQYQGSQNIGFWYTQRSTTGYHLLKDYCTAF